MSSTNPLVLAGFGMILLGMVGTVIPLATVNFSAGPVSASVSGISAFSAFTLFAGLVLIVLGLRRRGQS